jgi:Ca2+-transporting ATPase
MVKLSIRKHSPNGAQSNKLFFGTSVVNGRAKAQIVFTGKQTRFGKLALTLSELEDEKTPLEKNLSKLAQTIAILAFITSTLLFSLRLMQEVGAKIALLESIALLVAAVPEGLPTAITFILVMGVRRMYHKKTLVRKLSAIESLGSTTVICTDKTGTLTQNKLSVTEVSTKNIAELIKTAVICNSAQLVLKEDHGTKDILGDETEGALLFWAEDQKATIDQLRAEAKIVEEMPFDSKTRMMAVLAKEKQTHTLYIKGAPEAILPLTSLSPVERKAIDQTYQSYAKQGLRVLAFASKTKAKAENKIESELKGASFIGLIAIADTIRPEAITAVTKAHKANIKVVMITGDNELTAKAIGEQVGILKPNDEIMLGVQLEELSDEELDKRISQVAVFARCIPEHKLRIVQSYQRLGEVVAVTGDGVNDALALKQAQIGVAMGKIGTDVAKEASDMVIQDDNFATLVDAIEEGRLIYSNILKTVKFLMAGNLSEVLVIFLSGLLGFPPLLQPAQILWINFVTDGLPALTLAFDKSSTSLMSTGPRSRTDAIVGRKNLTAIALSGIAIAMVNLAIFIAARIYFSGVAQTIVFCTIVITQIIFVMILRKDQPLLSNKYFIFSVIFVLLLQGLIVTMPGLRELFHLEAL